MLLCKRFTDEEQSFSLQHSTVGGEGETIGYKKKNKKDDLIGKPPFNSQPEMSSCVKRNLSLLKLLMKSSSQQKKAILCSAFDDLLPVISETVPTTLKGNIPLTQNQGQVLKKKKRKKEIYKNAL